jgi:enamine deaminase RidA (YjgF/YER057c/UK114 family)
MKNHRQQVSTGAPWEPVVGYSRAIRIGNIIEVSGTTSMKDGKVYAPHDPGEQTRYILQIIRESLETLGASLEDVTRTRIFVTDVKDWEVIARAHGELFSSIRPACSMVGVKELIEPGLVVEIEASAFVYPESCQ